MPWLFAVIDAKTEAPPGGVIRRQPDSNEPNGVLEERAVYPFVFHLIPEAFKQTDFTALMERTIEYFASFGVTTIQDGATTPEDLALLRAIAAKEPLKADVTAFLVYAKLSEDDYHTFTHEPEYNNGLRLAGVKWVLDGSPQGRTAWMTEPYHELPEGVEPGYVAYPSIDPDFYLGKVGLLIERGVPVLVHANGDAAMDLMMDGIDKALDDNADLDHRAVIIHAQLMRPDQLDRAAELGVVPSYFSAHTFFWGDWHRESFGEKRAAHISPTGSALAKGVPSEEVAPKFHCPTLLVSGDPKVGKMGGGGKRIAGAITLEMMLHIRELNDKVEFARIAGVGHSIQTEDPTAFVATIVPFIRRHSLHK